MKILITIIILLFNSQLLNAWESVNVMQGNTKFFVSVEIQKSWSATFTNSTNEATFCFEGPFLVKKNENYIIKMKIGNGQWFDAPFSAFDKNTLCTYETGKSRGLFGALITHGKFSVGINTKNDFVETTFYENGLKSQLGI